MQPKTRESNKTLKPYKREKIVGFGMKKFRNKWEETENILLIRKQGEKKKRKLNILFMNQDLEFLHEIGNQIYNSTNRNQMETSDR